MNVRSPEYRAWEMATDRTRSNALSAAIAALCLLYFGYFGGYSKPVVTDLFSVGNLIFYYCLRIGGIAMAIIAAVSAVGAPVVLLCDAVVSVLIGGMFIASAGMMLADGGGGLNPILMIVFGAMFISAGLRNGRAYFAFRSAGTASDADGPIRIQNPSPRDDGFDHYANDRRSADPPAHAPADRSASLAGQLLRHTRDQVDSSAPVASPAAATPRASAAPQPSEISREALTTSTGDSPPEARPASSTRESRPPELSAAEREQPRPMKTESPPPAPEEGFLAAFAPKQDEPPR